ncbi:hypothetical protein, partial [Streptomyces sp. NPDC000229]|uniref:hypothetical protein n=1 Tax=Streptomyces sp. NPDC000229 TaxID=3154247 RepID=UPI00331F233E
ACDAIIRALGARGGRRDDVALLMARLGGIAPDDVAPILQELGAYVGEVLVREARARWVDFDDMTSELFRQPVGVRTSDGQA